jgi:2-hydroxychromene-2-carboxylate isomerase
MPVAPTPAVLKQPVFYYDLGVPACYLMAEQVMAALPAVPEWEPVLASDLDLGGGGPAPSGEEIGALADALGLQALRWPERWPPDTRRAMLAATYAKGIGRAVAFSLAAFRQAFAAGRDLGEEETVLIAGAACEMHPSALLKGIGLRSVARALNDATDRARRAGARSLPAVQVGDRLFEGADALERATLAVAR